MPDLFLYAGEPNPQDVRLSDPTTQISSGGISGTSELTEVGPTLSSEGLLQFLSTGAILEISATLAATGALNFQCTSVISEAGAELSASGSVVGIPITGTAELLSSPAQIEATGSIPSAAVDVSSGGGWSPFVYPRQQKVSGSGALHSAATILAASGQNTPPSVSGFAFIRNRAGQLSASGSNQPMAIRGQAQLLPRPESLVTRGFNQPPPISGFIKVAPRPALAFLSGAINTDELDSQIAIALVELEHYCEEEQDCSLALALLEV